MSITDPHSGKVRFSIVPAAYVYLLRGGEVGTAGGAGVEVLLTGEDEVDWPQALAELGRRGLQRVLCEGGPSLFAGLTALDLVDELCLTVSPVLVAGDGQRISTGGEPAEQARFGDRLTQEQRYARTDEFLTVVRGAWDGGFDFTGEYYDVRDARTREAPDPLPELYFGGSSPAAGPVAAKHVDVYLTWGEPVDLVAEKLDWIRGLAKEQGRELRFGIRLHVITRDTSEAAWAVAQQMLDELDPAVVAQAQDTLGASLSVGQQRMRALHEGRRDARDAHDLEVAPGLWAGVGLVRGGAGTALVGSHREVAELVEQYRAIGIEEFVLSGYPHVEEAYWFAEGVRPLLG